MTLPESWQFLGTYWWILHVVAIVLVFYLGYVIGKNVGEGESPEEQESIEKKEGEGW